MRFALPTTPKSIHLPDAAAWAGGAILIAFIFFLSIQSSTDSRNDGVQLPQSPLLSPAVPSQDIPIILEVLPDGVVVLDNAVYTKVELETALLQQRNMLEKRGRDKFAKATIILLADRAAKFGDVRDIVHLCEKTGFKQFSLRADCAPSNRR